MQRIKTGIKNLDKKLNGGIPQGNTTYILGSPGTGKTTLGLEFLYRGAEKGEPGVYISFQDTENRVLKTTTYNWDFESKINEDLIDVTKFDPYRYEDLPQLIRGRIRDLDAERVVVDPITDMSMYIETMKDRRKTLLEVRNQLRDSNVTSLLLGADEISTEIEEEIPEGIIELEREIKKDSTKNFLKVKKMARTSYSEGKYRYKITSDGIELQ